MRTICLNPPSHSHLRLLASSSTLQWGDMGRTQLMKAVERGDVAAVKCLIAARVDLEARQVQRERRTHLSCLRARTHTQYPDKPLTCKHTTLLSILNMSIVYG